jgi:hypothetical protein
VVRRLFSLLGPPLAVKTGPLAPGNTPRGRSLSDLWLQAHLLPRGAPSLLPRHDRPHDIARWVTPPASHQPRRLLHPDPLGQPAHLDPPGGRSRPPPARRRAHRASRPSRACGLGAASARQVSSRQSWLHRRGLEHLADRDVADLHARRAPLLAEETHGASDVCGTAGWPSIKRQRPPAYWRALRRQ